MAAPVAAVAAHSPRGTAIMLTGGYQTLITITGHESICFWQKTVQPPGYEGGDPIDITTMHNLVRRTFYPRALITFTEATIVVAYDPKVYDEILAIINRILTYTVHFPDGSTLAFFGFLRLFEPQTAEEGGQPEANIVIHPSSYDSANYIEAGEVVVEVLGT